MATLYDFADSDQQGVLDTDEYVTCRICGKRFEFITGAHLKQHNITITDYRQKFPGAKTICNKVSKSISESNTGMVVSEERKKRISETLKTTSHFHILNKNQKGKTYEEIYGEEKAREKKKKMSEGQKEINNKPPVMQGEDNPLKDPNIAAKVWKTRRERGTDKHDNNTRRKMSEAKKDKTWEEIFGTEVAKKRKEVLSKRMKNNPKIMRKAFLTSMNKGISNIPTNPEKQLNHVLDDLFPNEFKYNEGQFLINNKVPDFFNSNGKKQLIELFGCYWHCCKECFPNIESAHKIHARDNERLKMFSDLGYRVLVIWEHELENLEEVKAKICRWYNE